MKIWAGFCALALADENTGTNYIVERCIIKNSIQCENCNANILPRIDSFHSNLLGK